MERIVANEKDDLLEASSTAIKTLEFIDVENNSEDKKLEDKKKLSFLNKEVFDFSGEMPCPWSKENSLDFNEESDDKEQGFVELSASSGMDVKKNNNSAPRNNMSNIANMNNIGISLRLEKEESFSSNKAELGDNDGMGVSLRIS